MQDTSSIGFALSPQQMRLASYLAPGRAGEPYVAQVVIEVEGRLDQNRLRQALEAVIRRHEILRTQFVARPGLKVPLQAILPEQAVSPDLFTLSFICHDGRDDHSIATVPDSRFHAAGARLIDATISQNSDGASMLTLSAPAICADAASLKTIARDLAESYNAAGALSAGVVQYADVAEYFNSLLESEFGAVGRQYWRPRVAAAGRSQLRRTSTAPDQTPFQPSMIRTEIPASVIQAACSRLNQPALSDELFLLTCWHVLLSRLCQTENLAIGYAARGRMSPEMDGGVGLFETYLPVELATHPDKTFAEASLAMIETIRQGEKWQAAFQWPDDRGFHFAAFSYYDADWSFQAGPVTLRCAGVRVCSDRYCIKLNCTSLPGRVSVELWYDPLIYDGREVQQMASQFVTLVESASETPEAPIRSLNIIGESERHLLVYALNETDQDFPSTSLESRFEQQVGLAPDAVALVCEGSHVSYSGLNERAEWLARQLRKEGVGPESRVALCLNRGTDAVVAMLAVLKAGGAYVPLDPAYPRERLAYMLEDAKAALLLTSRSLLDQFSSVSVRAICLDGEWGEAACGPDNNATASALPDNSAYILYTSGSTGNPKGVVVTRQGLMNYLNWACDVYEFAPCMRTPLYSSLSFDLTVTSLWPPLLTGGCVIIITEDAGMEGLVSEGLQGGEYGVIKVTPSHLSLIEHACESEGNAQLARRFVIGGEALNWEELGFWLQQAPSCTLVNEYGPTESVVGCCVFTASGPTAAGSGPVPIGRPIANTRLFLLDDSLTPAPLGVAGELFIAGAGLARGYWQLPEQTAERFLPDPFATRAGARLYRTGDLGRWRADVQMEYLGRLDQQVKLRGYRIELGEIEAVLSEHEGVEQAAVVVREEETGRRLLVAYYTGAAGEPAAAVAELQEHLKRRLPEYMMPQAYVELERMPLTGNGKVDRRGLPRPEQEGKAGYIGPRTEAERELCEIWERLLGVERVGVKDNFFELGGDSILSIQVVTRAREVGLKLTPRQFFQHQTIEELAEVAERAEGMTGGGKEERGEAELTPIQRAFFERGIDVSDFPNLELSQEELDNVISLLGRDSIKAGIESVYPVTPMQAGLLFHSLYAPGTGTYAVQMACRIEGELEVGAFKQAWQSLLDQHEVLRTSFVWEGLREPLQVVHRQVEAAWDERDWRQMEPEQQKQRLGEYLRQDRQADYDFGRAPLMRLGLMRITERGYYFVWSSHHILFDGWCKQLLVGDLFRAYEARRRGEELRVREARPYREYVAWLRGQEQEEAEEYWRGELKGLSGPTRLWGERRATGQEQEEQKAEQEEEVGEEVMRLGEELSRRVEQMGRGLRVTMNAVAQSAWGIVMSRSSGEREVVFGAVVSGRGAALKGIEGMVGLFVNTVPVRLEVRGEETVKEYVRRVSEVQVRSMAYEYSPLQQIQGWSELPRGTPLFESIFLFQNYPSDGAISEQAGSRLRITKIGGFEKVSYPLMLIVVPGPELHLKLAYDPERFDGAVIRRLLEHIRAVLEAMARNPEQRVEEISSLNDSERQQVLIELNDTRRDLGEWLCAHELFERQAERTPDAVALAYREQRLSYATLNEQANRLAHYMTGLGVGREDKVGICVERSAEMLIALLAVLKTGGAYVPLDSNYPVERLAFMAEDALLKENGPNAIVLTQSHIGWTPPAAVRCIELDREWETIATYPVTNPAVEISDANLAYVIYTSGSTGRPKGVMITHGGLHNYLLWAAESYGVNECSGSVVHSSISFDLTITGLFVPLLCGKVVTLVDEMDAVSTLARATEVSDAGSLVKLTPGQMELIKAQLQNKPASQFAKILVIGGEALNWEELGFWLQQAPSCTLINEYGPTESVVGCCVFTASGLAAAGSGPVPIGRPIANTRLFLLDDSLTPAPLGVAGELFIAGAGLARGYWQLPEQTAERFLPDPFATRAGARLYRTGDLGRWRADVQMEYLGRLDQQVKLRGYRIELGEIEAVMSEHEGVEQAAVVVREEETGRRLLVAYYTGGAGEPAAAVAELQEHLKRRLPEYMMPQAYVELERMPLTGNGKVDRRGLPRPEQEGKAGYIGPRTEAERELCEIWERLLGVERVGVKDNFFELGGDSILSIQVVTRAREVGLKLTPRQFFQHQTIEELAEVAERAEGMTGGGKEERGEAELTPIQRAFFGWTISEPDYYNQAVMLEVMGGVDSLLLERAVDALVRHHDALRMRFQRQQGGEWKASYCEASGQAPYERKDLSGVEAGQRKLRMQEDAAKVQASLKLSQGHLVKAVEYELSEMGRRLLIVIHHLVMDGVSWRVLLEDMGRAYGQLERGQRVSLGAKTTSYGEWAGRLRQYSQSQELRQEAEYWKGVGRGSEHCRVPVDYEQGANTVGSARSVTVWLSREQTRGLLQDAAAAYHAQINELLISAVAQAYRRWSGQGRVVIEMEGHGREDLFEEVDVTRTVGWFTTLYPVEVEVRGGRAAEWVRQVKQCLREVPRRGIGYGVLRYMSGDEGLERELTAAGRAQISFNYLGQFDQSVSEWEVVKPAEEWAGPSQSGENERRAELVVSGMVVEGRMRVDWSYSSNRYRRESIEGLGRHFEEVIDHLIEQGRRGDGIGYVPSDFPDLELSQEELDGLMARLSKESVR